MPVFESLTGGSMNVKSVRLPTRTMKNSCRLLQKMEMKFNRSSRGTDSSAPWSSTRSLKVSQESSRFCMNEWDDIASPASSSASSSSSDTSDSSKTWLEEKNPGMTSGIGLASWISDEGSSSSSSSSLFVEATCPNRSSACTASSDSSGLSRGKTSENSGAFMVLLYPLAVYS